MSQVNLKNKLKRRKEAKNQKKRKNLKAMLNRLTKLKDRNQLVRVVSKNPRKKEEEGKKMFIANNPNPKTK